MSGRALVLVALLGCARAPADLTSTAPPPSAPAPDPVAPAPPEDPHRRDANAQELALVRELMRETEALRGLRFKAPVRVTVEDRTAMRAYVERAIDDPQLERARTRYLSLGVLEPELDIRQLLVTLMEEELIGYYDPKEKRLAVREDVARALEQRREAPSRSLMWRATVVHELVHALQDQHFALGEKIHDARSTDADNAFGALVEGDATLTMLGYTAGRAGDSIAAVSAQPERVRQALTRTPEQLTGALRRAPALVREPLLFRYREGALFCAALHRAGGWAAIDAAHRAPPQSSYTIRHPQQALDEEAEFTIALPDLAWLGTHGFQVRDEDVLGSLELSIVLGLSDGTATALASAWRGDRYVVLEREGTLASLWWLRFVTPDAARTAAAGFARLEAPARSVARHGARLIVGYRVPDALFARAARSLRTSALDRERGTRAGARERTREAASTRADNGAHPLATAFHEH